MSLLHRSRVGLVLGALALVIVLLGAARTPAGLRGDGTSLLDGAASLLYLALPVLAMVATALTRHWLTPAAWDAQGPARPLRWRSAWALPTVLLPAFGSLLGSLGALAWAHDPGVAIESVLAYSLAPAASVALVTAVALAAERAIPHRAAPLAAGLATAALAILAPSLLYQLGATLALAGTRPEPGWHQPLLAMATLAALLTAAVVLGLRRRWVGWLLAGTTVAGVMLSLSLPGRLLDPVGDPMSCVATEPQVCSYEPYGQWRDATAGRAAQITRFARSEGLRLPVRLIAQSAADTHQVRSDDMARFAIGQRDPAGGVPAVELADALLGPTQCYENERPFSRALTERRALALWLAAEGAGDQEARRALKEEAPAFPAADAQARAALATRVQTKIASCRAG